MNELQILRHQLGLERQRALTVAEAYERYAAQPGHERAPFLAACRDYLAFAARRCGAPRSLDGSSPASPSSLTALRQELERRLDSLERLLSGSVRVDALREAAAIDADSILEERSLYQQVRAMAPVDLQLP